MHREGEQAGGTYVLRECSEAYGCELAQENVALTPQRYGWSIQVQSKSDRLIDFTASFPSRES